MNAQVNRQWLLQSRPEGMISPELFELVETTIPPLQEGEILAKTIYLSFDPTQRAWMAMDTYIPIIELGDVMRSGGIAQVVESKHSKYKPGDIINLLTGWQEYVVLNPDKPEFVPPTKLPGHLDPALMLALSLTGLTAYFGLLDIGRPKTGDTVLVSGAAGATGSIAGQIAKQKGCRVIGIAGGAEKCGWLTDKGKFDAAIDYKQDDIAEKIGQLCPGGVNVYFDNVGGPITDEVLNHLAQNARIVLCGAISQYNSTDADYYGLKNYLSLIINRGKAEGFIILDYLDRALEGILCLTKWVEDGAVVQEIDMREGFENAPQTLTRIFTGENLGKQLLKVCDLPLPTNTNAIERTMFNMIRAFTVWRKS
ncbi:MAG: NADP-dependent oxidoreductase [Pseudomonadota bacterium]